MAISGNLRVTPEKMISISGQFGNSNNTVRNLTTSMLNIATALKSTWGGEAATIYYQKLNGLQGDMNKLHKMIKEHTDDLQLMAKTYQTAERANQATAASLKNDQIV